MSYLVEMLSSTRARVAEAKERRTTVVLEQRIAAQEAPRDLARALRGDGISVIAEIKRVSPARGPLNRDLDAAALARHYARGGAAAISVLTEPEYFDGSLEDLEAARPAGLPVLRKDFMIDEWQLLESRASGADAVLLIVRALEEEALARLFAGTRALGMEALVEVHDDAEVERAVATGAAIIGVNHRNLETFEVDDDRTAKLAGLIPSGHTLVGLSGVSSRAEVQRLEAAGASAVLVGESLVTAADPVAKLRELRGSA
ncbi:MAG: indole-3-glycerol phosphate synthase TrpC [Actinomycetota bacterium]